MAVRCYNHCTGVPRIGDARGLQRETGRAVRCIGIRTRGERLTEHRIPAAGRGDTRARRCVLARSLPSAQRVFRRSRVSPRSAVRMAGHRLPAQSVGGGARHSAGATRSYLEVAQQIGSAPRPVGTACGANRIPLLIPCHRVVGSSGLGGFMHSRGGKPLEIKRWLLRHEGAVALACTKHSSAEAAAGRVQRHVVAGGRTRAQHAGQLSPRPEPVRRLVAAHRVTPGCSRPAHADLLGYLAHRFQAKARPSSTARLLSSLKRFYQFAVRQGKLAADPTLNIDSPKLPARPAQEPHRTGCGAAPGRARRGDPAGTARQGHAGGPLCQSGCGSPS